MLKNVDARGSGEMLEFELDGKAQQADWAWHRGEHCNFNPARANLQTGEDVLKYVLAGWAPPSPLIEPATRVTAFGSCFAGNISVWLADRNFTVLNKDQRSDAHIVRMAEGMVNTFAIAEQFRWALEGVRYEGEFWHGYDAKAFGYSEDIRLATREILLSTDVFIITLGLSEIWYDEVTGGVFWRAVPRQMVDPERHKFRVATFAENKSNIETICRLISEHRPGAKIIFTVSPIPLVATFRPNSCLVSNSASKALLRGAVDEVYREWPARDLVYYWPAYEIVLDVFDNRWKRDRRHPRREILDFIMTAFEHAWCRGHEPGMSVDEAFARARQATR